MYWNDVKRFICVLTTFFITTHALSTDIPILPVEEMLIYIIKRTFRIKLDNIIAEKMVQRHMQRCKNKLKIVDHFRVTA
mgnify:CR=1 FL=1